MKCVAGFLVLCVVAAVSGHPANHGDVHAVHTRIGALDPKANMNEYFDALLAQVRIYFLENNMVPMILPDSIHGFCVRVMFVDWHGELELTNGWLLDLTTIARRGDAELFYGDKVMNVKAVIGFDFLQMHYDYLAKVMNIGPDGGIDATIIDVTFLCDIVVNMETGLAHVNTLDVLSTGSLDIHFTGTIIVDQIANVIADIITFLFKNVIMDMIALALKVAINNVLEDWATGTTQAPVALHHHQ